MLFSSGIDEEQKLSSYSDALYRAFVAIQEGQLTNEDYLAASLDDSVEILRLFYGNAVKIRKLKVKKAIKSTLVSWNV